MDPVLASRWLTFLILGYHILFATIGVGMPLLIVLIHWLGLKSGDRRFFVAARRVMRGFAVSVAVGVVTGTSIGLMLSLLWPGFMALAGQTIALPLFLETFAFFLEAIFFGIYLYTWDRWSNPRRHWMLLWPGALAASASAFFITSVNAFMNTPQGALIAEGKVLFVSPWEAMFSPATATKVSHVLSSAYMTSAFVLVSVAAWNLLKGGSDQAAVAYHRRLLAVSIWTAFVFSGATAIVGDLSGKFLAAYQPEKLAAAEWLFTTEKAAPLVLFGILDGTTVRYALRIPYLLSVLAFGRPEAEVVGLSAFPDELWPPLVIHYFFDAMVAIGIGLFVLAGYALWWAGRKRPYPRWLLGLLVASGPLAMLAIELGWIFTEMGRQPWIIRGVMRTAEAATSDPAVAGLIFAFAALFAALTVGAVTVFRRLVRLRPLSADLARLEHPAFLLEEGIGAPKRMRPNPARGGS